MSEPVYLTFHPYDPHEHVEEQRSLCLWTDGVMYWTGWWSRDEQALYVANADGTNGRMDDSRIRWWASLPNLHMVMHTHPLAERIIDDVLKRTAEDGDG